MKKICCTAWLGRCCSVEVGCGTGDVILSLAGDFKHSLGLDINDGFLAYAKQHTPEDLKDKVWHLNFRARCAPATTTVDESWRGEQRACGLLWHT